MKVPFVNPYMSTDSLVGLLCGSKDWLESEHLQLHICLKFTADFIDMISTSTMAPTCT